MITATRSATLLVAAALVTGCAAPTPAPTSRTASGAPLAITDVGGLRGAADGDVVRFRGVPYAEPPVGDLRWAPPEPVAAWMGERDATTAGPACAQSGSDLTSQQEDCLRLDVTAPAAPGSDRPVMVWLHGGGFNVGAGTEIDPRRMAVEGDVVVVSVEFRIGIFGYLALPGMTDGGTFGLADQQEALRFVRRNAAAFGGDPDNVTLFGQSGGAVAGCGQLTSPSAEGLFDRVILQSAGPCRAPIPPNGVLRGTPEVPYWRPLAEVESDGVAAAARLGCTDPTTVVDCLRGLDVDRVLTEHNSFAAGAVGGPLLPVDPATALSDVSDVQVLSGHTSDESLPVAGLFELLQQPITEAGYPDLIRAGFGDRADEVLARYPIERHGSAARAWAGVYTDRMWVCPQLLAADELSSAVPVHAYEFADPTAPPYIPAPPGLPPGAGHTSELAYLFDLAGKPAALDGTPIPLTAAQLDLASEMIEAWTTFARTGTVDGVPRWSPDDREALAFGADTPTTRPWTEHSCDFWSGEPG